MSSSDPDRICKNSTHWRNDSGELDVFEAARYFSGASESPAHNNAAILLPQKFITDGERASRISLDLPTIRINPHNLAMDQKQLQENNIKCRQPSSPAGRLSSFLNSLFNQTTSKKTKMSKFSNSNSNSNKDLEEEESPSIRTSNAANDSKSLYSPSINSGSITPSAPYANTPRKSSYKELKSFSDHLYNGVSEPKNGANIENVRTNRVWMDEKSRISNGDIFKNGSFGNSDRNSPTNWTDEEREFRKFSDVDDGADTDSSSDLFDLPNHDLDFYSSSTGLPVYGTTHVARIRIGAPISSTTTV